MNLMEALNSVNMWGVSMIKSSHYWFSDYEQIITKINHLSDPAYAFSVVFPLVCMGDTLLGANLLFVAMFTEWISTMLKWMLREDRPYWWVHETGFLMYPPAPLLNQGPLCCDTSAGNPSGHVACTAALVYVLIRACGDRRSRFHPLLICLLWISYIVALLLVSLSRTYVGAQFPHQCLLGAAVGYIIGRCLGDGYLDAGRYHGCLVTRWQQTGIGQSLLLTFATFITSLGAYWLQKVLPGLDPQWSVRIAFRWCSDPHKLEVATTPLFSLARCCGLTLGAACVPQVSRSRAAPHGPFGLVLVAVTALLYCTALRMAQSAVPGHDARLFYMCHALLYATMPYVLLAVVPRLAGAGRRRSTVAADSNLNRDREGKIK